MSKIILPPAVRILPMNRHDERNELKDCNNTEDVQHLYFLDALPKRPDYDYQLRTGLRAEEDTVILFQCDSSIIASAILLSYKSSQLPDEKGWRSLYLKKCSIEVFNPVPKDTIIRIWPNVKKLGNVRWILPPEGYAAFRRELQNVRKPHPCIQ